MAHPALNRSALLERSRAKAHPTSMAKPAHKHECTDPSHHVHDAKGFVRAVEESCETRGLRLTPLRAQVLGPGCALIDKTGLAGGAKTHRCTGGVAGRLVRMNARAHI